MEYHYNNTNHLLALVPSPMAKRPCFADAETGDKVSIDDILDRFVEKQCKLLDEKLGQLLDTKIAQALAPLNARLEALENRAGPKLGPSPCQARVKPGLSSVLARASPG